MAGGEPGTHAPTDEAPLTVQQTVADGRARVIVRGELDAFTAPDLLAGIDEAAGDEVQLDLAGVSFIDSSGLASVIAGHQRLDQEHRRLVIVERSEIVQRLLDLSGVASRLHLDPTP
jgi:anti-anti-sigma factor